MKRPDLERVLREQVKESGAPGAVALVRTAKGTWHGAVGFSNLSAKRTMRASDRFSVGSVTKTFVATVVLQLVGEHRLRLDDTVERWLPGLLPEGSKISIRRLLNHTSGVFNYLDDRTFEARLERNPHLVVSPRAKIALAASHSLNFRPGTSWSYSNTNYLVLRLIVEKATNNTIAEELTRRIFKPLGLDHTAFESPGHQHPGSRMRGYNLSGIRPRDATLDTLGGLWQKERSSPTPTTSPASSEPSSTASCSTATYCRPCRRQFP